MSTQMKRKKTSVQESFVGFAAVKDTTGQGLAEKLIEVIENNFGLEEDSERHPSFNPGENVLPILSMKGKHLYDGYLFHEVEVFLKDIVSCCIPAPAVCHVFCLHQIISM